MKFFLQIKKQKTKKQKNKQKNKTKTNKGIQQKQSKINE